jgi:hypothetical protein
MTTDSKRRNWKSGHVWTRAHLEKQLRLVDIRNFAKRKMAGLEDDIYDNDWGPNTEESLKAYLTGYNAALDDLQKWCMEQISE